jgi:pyruvate formate lyase activating enzyme
MSCAFCQNHRVSQQATGKSVYYSPSELVALALERNVSGIAFTYNEPTLYHEYIEEVGHEIHRSESSSHLKLVIKTSGFARPWVMRNLCLYADAINIDIKGNNEDYKKTCGGWLDPVLESIELIVRMKVHLEISYLVLPDKVRDEQFNIYFRNWLADIDPEIPVHLLYFYPFHKMVIPSYKPSELLSLRNMMLDKMHNVYVSNHFGNDTSKARDTHCRTCGNGVIVRQKGSVSFSHCCGTKLSGVFAD